MCIFDSRIITTFSISGTNFQLSRVFWPAGPHDADTFVIGGPSKAWPMPSSRPWARSCRGRPRCDIRRLRARHDARVLRRVFVGRPSLENPLELDERPPTRFRLNPSPVQPAAHTGGDAHRRSPISIQPTELRSVGGNCEDDCFSLAWPSVASNSKACLRHWVLCPQERVVIHHPPIAHGLA